jgi:hypothetical protein
MRGCGGSRSAASTNINELGEVSSTRANQSRKITSVEITARGL